MITHRAFPHDLGSALVPWVPPWVCLPLDLWKKLPPLVIFLDASSVPAGVMKSRESCDPPESKHTASSSRSAAAALFFLPEARGAAFAAADERRAEARGVSL